MNYIHLIDRLSTNEMLLKFNNIDHSIDEKSNNNLKKCENKNKAINRGVIPLFAEPNETEWACCVHQRVEMWMKWVMDCFSEGWKVRQGTKTVQREI